MLRNTRFSYQQNFMDTPLTREEEKRRIGEELRNYSVITEPSKRHGQGRQTMTRRLGFLDAVRSVSVSQPRKTYTGKGGWHARRHCHRRPVGHKSEMRTFLNRPRGVRGQWTPNGLSHLWPKTCHGASVAVDAPWTPRGEGGLQSGTPRGGGGVWR